ncbi:MAG: Dabb family protein [Nitrospirae bacterium]|nr:Dabb family protein [Nitrospirota bacterium]
MIKHFVMFRMKEAPAKEENTRKLKALLESLKESIPQVLHLEVGINQGKSKNSTDLILYTEMADMAALEIYQKHPEHVRVVEYVDQVCSERRVVDYEAGEA